MTLNNSVVHHRRSIRLKAYDYSQAGLYFITICSYKGECLFGKIDNDGMVLNEVGEIINDEWIKSQTIRKEIEMGVFVIMPNHFHGIVRIVGANGRSPLQEPRIHMGAATLSSLVAGFKSACTKKINQIRNMPGVPVWQRNYYEHVIRDEESHRNISEYIINNPLKWNDDEYYEK
ncbi:transposase [bacterium]|nr:transposase [bacterium]